MSSGSGAANATVGRGAAGWVPLVVIGLCAGVLSGAFGIGGGVLIVPLLVGFLHFPQRLAAGTSLAAILPTSIVGVVSYALTGNIDWVTGILLAVGMVVGVRIGAALLQRLSVVPLKWIFIGFMLLVAASLWFVIPERSGEVSRDLLASGLLVLAGAATGVLSGLLGVGGGVIIVPVLVLLFGSSDVAAKGASLVMMVPGSLSGTLANARRKNVDLRAAACIGLAACAVAPLGVWCATLMSPFVSNVLFSILLVVLMAQMALSLLRARRARGVPGV